jgi:hypothetical protein
MKKNIEICYYGGTGGFFLLWGILLASKDYLCEWEEPYNAWNLNDVFRHHWNIDLDTWKSTEIWPNNKKTRINNSIKNKIYFDCNPRTENILKLKNIKPKDLTKVTIYTDIETHFKLINFKKCFLYRKYSRLEDHMSELVISKYNSINLDLYPAVENFAELLKLSDSQIEELDRVFNFKIYESVEETYIKNCTFTYNNEQLYYCYKELIEDSDIVVKWQDVVKTNGNCILNKLGLSTNEKIIDFIKFYVDQHPAEIKNLLIRE